MCRIYFFLKKENNPTLICVCYHEKNLICGNNHISKDAFSCRTILGPLGSVKFFTDWNGFYFVKRHFNHLVCEEEIHKYFVTKADELPCV